MSMPRPFNALPLLLLLSGFAGISYEVLYGRLLGNLIGDQFAVSASVLITFLLGSGLGAVSAHRLWRWLWLIEAGIGACGVAFALSHDALHDLLYSGHISAASGLATQVGVGVVLLLPPAFLVGCSVPLFSGYLADHNDDAGFAKVYAIYNIGAGITAVALEFLVVRTLGITGAILGFSLVNFLVAGWLRWQYPAIPAPTPDTTAARRFPTRALWALILAAVASAIFQLYMVKLSEFMFGPFRETFALVLAIVLFGIAAGTAIVKRYAISFSTLMLVNLAGLLLLLVALEPAVYAYARAYPAATEQRGTLLALKTCVLLALMALPSLTFGATVPALLTRAGEVAKESGYLLFVAALANSAGFVLMVFVLHPYLDYGVQLLVMAGLSATALLLYRGLGLKDIEMAVIATALLLSAHRWLWDESLLYMNYTTFQSVEELQDTRSSFKVTDQFKGHQDIFSITWIDGKPYFFINGYISFPLNSSSEQIVGLLSSMFAPRADEALVLGLGSGSTASVVGMAFDHTDAVEINPAVRANLGKLKKWNYDIEHNPKVNIILDDAIHYVRGAGKKYSLVLNTVTSPLYFSSAKLYTLDFFKAIKQHLRDDGIYVTWVDSRIGDIGINIILKTLGEAFQECSLFYVKSTYFLIACGDKPVTLRQTHLAPRAPEVWRELAAKYLILPEWLPYSLVSGQALSLLENKASVPVNTLDFPILEFEIAKLKHKGIPKFREILQRRVTPEAVAGPLAVLGTLKPARLVVEAEQRLDEDAYLTRAWAGAIRAAMPSYSEEHTAARLEYWQALAALADTAKAHHKYGYQLLINSRYREAIVEFEKTLALDDRYDNAYFNIAAAYEFMGDYAKALDYYQRELAIDSEDQETIYRMGRTHVELGDYEKAWFYLNAPHKNFDGAKGVLYRARALQGIGRRDEALELYRQVVRDRSAVTGVIEDAQRRLEALTAQQSVGAITSPK